MNPEQHVAELARVADRRRHRVRDHAEPPGRLREPVPRRTCSRRRSSRRCCALFFDDVDRAGARRSTELHADFAQRRASGEKLLRLDPLEPAPARCRAAGTCGATSTCCPSSTGCSARRAPASARGSTSRTSSSPTTIAPTTPGLFAVARAAAPLTPPAVTRPEAPRVVAGRCSSSALGIGALGDLLELGREPLVDERRHPAA